MAVNVRKEVAQADHYPTADELRAATPSLDADFDGPFGPAAGRAWAQARLGVVIAGHLDRIATVLERMEARELAYEERGRKAADQS